ncbi:MAG: FkbM family methyltransferase [Pseudomonadota bacterium]
MNAPNSLPAPDATLLALLRPQRLTAVVDVGANPIDGEAPYQPLLSKRVCTVTGFEPQPNGLAFLNQRKSDLETYLPYVIGDGSPQILHVTAMPGMTSLFEPNFPVLDWFNGFSEWSQVKERVPVQTRRLDDLAEIAAIDMLKIDVQGAELMVFRGASEKLSRAVAIHTEVCFLDLYKEQPLFGDVDVDLRSRGFIPHHLHHVNRRTILPTYSEGSPNSAFNQVLFADIIYIRDFTKHELMDDEQFKHLALIAHHCYKSHDLAIHCLARLAGRNAIAPNAVDVFIGAMRAAASAAG